MSYELHFHPSALKEWEKLNRDLREQFKKILKRRLTQPHVPGARLRGKLDNCYKIKLRQAGYRLVYHVDDNQLIILVVAIGKRNKNKIYNIAELRNEVVIP